MVTEPHLDYMFSGMLNNFVVQSCGRDVCKTTSLLEKLSIWAMMRPYKKTAYVVPNEKHLVETINDLDLVFSGDEFLKLFMGTFTRKERQCKFHTGHLIEARIFGADDTGEKTFIALHPDAIVIDEAQLIPSQALSQLTSAGKANFEYVIAGVPNDLRTSALWYGVVNPNFEYYHYASYEGPNWFGQKKEELMKQTGMTKEDIEAERWTDNWRNLIEGLFGESAELVFPPTKILKSIKAINYKYQKFQNMTSDRIMNRMELTPKLPMAESYIVGMDAGYRPSPSVISVFANIRLPDGRIESNLIYRIELESVSSRCQADIIDIICDWYSPIGFGIDDQGIGGEIRRLLCDKREFPTKHSYYSTLIDPIFMNGNVVTGFKKEITPKGEEKDVEIKYANFHYGTILLQQYLEQGLIKFPKSDPKMIDILQAETAKPNKQRRSGYTYNNPVCKHTTDSFRLFAIVRFKLNDQPKLLPDRPVKKICIIPRLWRFRKG